MSNLDNTTNILIGGCSFSENQGYPENGTSSDDFIWIPWSDLLKSDYDGKGDIRVFNVAQSSFGQSRIVESVLQQLIKFNYKIDYVFIQWSAVGRAYSVNEDEFFNRLIHQWEIPFSPHRHEYISNNDKGGWCTDLTNEIDSAFYTASLTQILLMKNVLENHNIPYTMFWGWEQLSNKISDENKLLLSNLYDDNWWFHGETGGMSEYIQENIGNVGFYNPPNDFHPSTKGHKLFYDNIIKPIFENKIKYNEPII